MLGGGAIGECPGHGHGASCMSCTFTKEAKQSCPNLITMRRHDEKNVMEEVDFHRPLLCPDTGGPQHHRKAGGQQPGVGEGGQGWVGITAYWCGISACIDQSFTVVMVQAEWCMPAIPAL